MISKRSVLGLIPARGGSKGIKRKNLIPLGEKPLIAWTIDSAKKSGYLDQLIVSSDDDEIIEVARHYGCDAPFRRSSQLSTDKTPSMDVVRDALIRCPGFDYVVLLQPTSPLRTAQDIDRALECCVSSRAPACVSVCSVSENPHWMYTMGADQSLVPFLASAVPVRRQDLPKMFSLNGAIYIAETDWAVRSKSFVGPNTVGFEMPVERSVDIDTELDLMLAQLLLDRGKTDAVNR